MASSDFCSVQPSLKVWRGVGLGPADRRQRRGETQRRAAAQQTPAAEPAGPPVRSAATAGRRCRAEIERSAFDQRGVVLSGIFWLF
jgi:hypothetical protein